MAPPSVKAFSRFSPVVNPEEWPNPCPSPSHHPPKGLGPFLPFEPVADDLRPDPSLVPNQWPPAWLMPSSRTQGRSASPTFHQKIRSPGPGNSVTSPPSEPRIWQIPFVDWIMAELEWPYDGPINEMLVVDSDVLLEMIR